MLNNRDRLELVGRMWLWMSAIVQTQKLLRLAERAKIAVEQPNIKDEQNSYNIALNNFKKTLPDYKKGVLTHTQKQAFDATYQRAFPIINECSSIHNACVELAIIYFCQILNCGHRDPGNAAKNDKLFIKEHLGAISKKLFSSQNEIDKFNNLCSDLKKARDEMLGHADAKSFDIQHGESVSSMKLHCQAWQDIDIEYWSSFLENFRVLTLQYSNEKAEEMVLKQS